MGRVFVLEQEMGIWIEKPGRQGGRVHDL